MFRDGKANDRHTIRSNPVFNPSDTRNDLQSEAGTQIRALPDWVCDMKGANTGAMWGRLAASVDTGGYWWILVDTTVNGRMRLAMVTTHTTVSSPIVQCAWRW